MRRLAEAALLALCGLCLAVPAARAALGEVFAEVIPGRPDRGGTLLRAELDGYGRGADGRLRQRGQKLEATVPLRAEGETKWKAFAGADRSALDSDLRFPDGRGLPRQLWNLGAGALHVRDLGGDRRVGGALAVGSASDRPFASGRELTFNGNLFYRRPGGGDATWVFLLNLSNTRSFLNYLPLPGFAYFFSPAEHWRLALGLPFLFSFWNPAPKWVITASYLPLKQGEARVSYFLFGPAQAYLQAKYDSRNFWLHGRSDVRERLFEEKALAQAGIVMPVARGLPLLLDLSGGLAFDRKFFLSRKSSDWSAGQMVRAPKAAIVTIRLSSRF